MKASVLLFIALPVAALGQSGPGNRYAELRDKAQEALNKGERDEVVRANAEALAIAPEDGQVWLEQGRSLLALKRYDEAIAAYQKAIRYGAFVNKFLASAQYDVACAYALKGDKAQAWSWLDKAMANGFRDLDHLRADTDLKSLHGDKRWEETAATKDVSKMSRDEGWRYDLWLLDREVRRVHLDPYRVTPKNDLDAFVKKLRADIPKLKDEQIAAQFVRFMALIGDGHTGVRFPEGPMRHDVPVVLYAFRDGVRCLGADAANKDLLGLRVTHVCGQAVDTVWDKVAPYIRRDNEMGVLVGVPQLLARPSFLFGIGVSPSPDTVDLTFEGPNGASVRRTLSKGVPLTEAQTVYANHGSANPLPLYLKNRAKPYWFEFLPASKVMYFQYNSVRNDPAEPLDKFAERLFKAIDESDVKTLVVDTRWNGGGNTFLSGPLVRGIAARAKLATNGGLYIVTGRQTFSACQNFVTDLGRLCQPIYVGEPTGSSPNFVGESVPFRLPYSKMTGTISDLYWQRSWPMDHRQWIAPDLPAPPDMEMIQANRDPALEAILANLARN